MNEDKRLEHYFIAIGGNSKQRRKDVRALKRKDKSIFSIEKHLWSGLYWVRMWV